MLHSPNILRRVWRHKDLLVRYRFDALKSVLTDAIAGFSNPHLPRILAFPTRQAARHAPVAPSHEPLWCPPAAPASALGSFCHPSAAAICLLLWTSCPTLRTASSAHPPLHITGGASNCFTLRHPLHVTHLRPLSLCFLACCAFCCLFFAALPSPLCRYHAPKLPSDFIWTEFILDQVSVLFATGV